MLESTGYYYIIGALSLLGLLVIVLMIAIIRLSSKYKAFMKLGQAISIDEVLINNQDRIIAIEKNLVDQKLDIQVLYDQLRGAFSKITITKYDAFEGMGGQMSAIIVLLNQHLDGILLNSIHSREGSHLYTKAIQKGASLQTLSKEEMAALKKTIQS